MEREVSHPATELSQPVRTLGKKPRGYWKDSENIERELKRLVDSCGHFPTGQEFMDTGVSSLPHYIAKTGGVKLWSERIGQPVRTREKGYWRSECNIESAIKKIIDERELTDFPSQGVLIEAGISSILTAITKTGGINKWREKMGFQVKKRRNKYWQDPENVLIEARTIMESHNLNVLPSIEMLKEMGYTSLVAAFPKYPGGLKSLREKLGCAPGIKKFPTRRKPEEIEQEALEFFTEFGELTARALRANGRRDLDAIIRRRYPGKLTALAEKLDLPIPERKIKGYWTEETVWEEAKKFLKAHGEISTNLLQSQKRHDLLNAIWTYFPGGFSSLKEKLGMGDVNPDVILASYEGAISAGAQITFSEFIKGEK